MKGTVYTICSIYAPTQDKPREQLETLNTLEEHLEGLSSTNIVVGGDLNCFLDPRIDRNSQVTSPYHTELCRNKIFSIMESWAICDIWRLRNPGKRGFTFRRGQYSSRLDYLLVPHHLTELVSAATMKMLPHSDHAMISVSIQPSRVQKGPGIWRLDTRLLDSEWRPPNELTNPISIWEWLKFEI